MRASFAGGASGRCARDRAAHCRTEPRPFAPRRTGMASATTIFVCTTCQRSDVARTEDELRSGEILHAALSELSPYKVEAVTCMNNCVNGCTVGFGAAGKWTYVFGDVAPGRDEDAVIAVAAIHAEPGDGQIPWGRRPETLKRKTVSRTPPIIAT
jgi:predicted metal-binding protein